MSDFPTQNFTDHPQGFITWLREDIQRLSEQVNKLERITAKIHEIPCKPLSDHIASKAHETPCMSFKDHIKEHEKDENRWWNIARMLVPYVMVALGAAAAVYYKVM